jgi:hypothetical protein
MPGTNWQIPTASMLAQVLNLAVMAKANENTDSDTVEQSQVSPPQQPIAFNPDLEDRATDLITLVVAQVREAIQVAGRIPLSVTPAAVPPKAVRHVLNVAAFQLINSTPNLQMVIITEKGASMPFQTFYKEGLAYIEGLEKGAGCLPPSDPTGIDYLTAVDPNTNPAVSAVHSLPIIGEIDMSTDNAPGGRKHGGTTPPNGFQCGNIGDVYEQKDASGAILKIWEKTYGWGNNIGWT